MTGWLIRHTAAFFKNESEFKLILRMSQEFLNNWDALGYYESLDWQLILGQMFTCQIEATLGQLGVIRGILPAPHTCSRLPGFVPPPEVREGREWETSPECWPFQGMFHLVSNGLPGLGVGCAAPSSQVNPVPLLAGTLRPGSGAFICLHTLLAMSLANWVNLSFCCQLWLKVCWWRSMTLLL